jgi:hypothetical protein
MGASGPLDNPIRNVFIGWISPTINYPNYYFKKKIYILSKLRTNNLGLQL